MQPSEVVRQRVRQLREEHGWTQTDLSRRLAQLGGTLDRTALVRVEQGRRAVRVEELFQLALALDVNVSTLTAPGADDEVQLTEGLISVSATGRELRLWNAGAVPMPPYQDAAFYTEHAAIKPKAKR